MSRVPDSAGLERARGAAGTPGFSSGLQLLLRAGVARLPRGFVTRHVRFARERQTADGGVVGAEGSAPDLYYAGFAVRLLGLLERGGEADPALRALVGWAAATGVGSDLSLPDAVAVVDVLRAVDQVEIVLDPGLRNALLDSCRTALEHHCRAPGVYSLLRGAEPGTYATFLGWLVEQGLGVEERPPERPGFLLGMRRPDGGFSESQACPRSAVNPTAAAVAVLLGEGGGLELDELGAVRDFVAANQTPEGGIRSGNGAVGPDLLSTFTGLVCLNRLGGRTALRLGDLARFVRDCGLPAGGFRAAPGQGAPDVEYTYYGLGALALLRLALDHASTLCPSR